MEAAKSRIKEISPQELALWCQQQERHPRGMVSGGDQYSLTGEYFGAFKKILDSISSSASVKVSSNTLDLVLPGMEEAKNDFDVSNFNLVVETLLCDEFALNKLKSKEIMSLITILELMANATFQEILDANQSKQSLFFKAGRTNRREVDIKKAELKEYLSKIEALNKVKEAKDGKTTVKATIRTFRGFFTNSNIVPDLQQAPITSREQPPNESKLLNQDGLHPMFIMAVFGLIVGWMTINGGSNPDQFVQKKNPDNKAPKTEVAQSDKDIEGSQDFKPSTPTKYLGISNSIVDTRAGDKE
jgi:hypothetical protein